MERTEETLKKMLQKEQAERVQRIGEIVLKKAEIDAGFKSWLTEKLDLSLNPESDPLIF